jgi:hypothetical protein
VVSTGSMGGGAVMVTFKVVSQPSASLTVTL